MSAKKLTLKKELAGVQTLVSQLQAQAGDGEIDAALIDQIADAVNVAVEQDGSTHDEAQGTAESMGAEAAPPAPAAPPHPEPDGDEVAKTLVSSRPGAPSFVIPGSAEEDMHTVLPEFIKALESGSIKKAQQIAGGSQPAFDTMFNMSCRAILTEGGFVYKNVANLHFGAPGQMDLKKAVSAGDFPGIYLMRLAKLMMPVYAGLRRRISAGTPASGSDKAMWRTQIGFSNLNKALAMGVAEAAIGETIIESPTTFEVPFRDMALNDEVNLKAQAAARGYDDPLQIAVIRIMTAILEGEERKILGDNTAAIAKPAAPTFVTAGSGTLGNNDDKFSVSALTYRGWLSASKGGTSAVGETDVTLSAAVDISGVASVTASWAAIPGAVAYNLFYYPHGANPHYVGTYTVNTATLTTVPSTGNAPSDSNVSANANGFEGLISWCELSTIYSKAIANKTAMVDNAGGELTTGTSGINEFDSILESLWTQWQIAPTAIICSPRGVGAITDKILALNSGAMYRIEMSQERGTLQGGAFLTGYVNKFAPFADGTPRFVDVIPHPYMPNGTFQFLCETIPYPMSRESRGFNLDVLIPYTYFPLAATRISYPFAVTLSEVLECFHPSAQTALVGVKV